VENLRLMKKGTCQFTSSLQYMQDAARQATAAFPEIDSEAATLTPVGPMRRVNIPDSPVVTDTGIKHQPYVPIL
jgi:hypothetical protein